MFYLWDDRWGREDQHQIMKYLNFKIFLLDLEIIQLTTVDIELQKLFKVGVQNLCFESRDYSKEEDFD